MIKRKHIYSKYINSFQAYSLVLFILATTFPAYYSYLIYTEFDVDTHDEVFTLYCFIFLIYLAFFLKRSYSLYAKDKIKQHISMITHDIKAPLSRIMFKMQVNNDYIVDYYKDIKEIECMINDIALAINECEISTYEKQKKIDFYSMVESIVEDYNDMGKNINLYSQKKLSSNIVVCPIFMKRAIINIIENSFKYGSKVELSMRNNNSEILLDIIDNGPGVDNKSLPKLKTAFYQGENSKEGKGLGLYISNKIIEEHYGVLTLSNNSKNGFKATIKLPIS
ncbi:sensor histidine kinase [Francisella sp. SYW-2]|uniref:sensor histidine kinase n=1 Tax=Francisella sp. SYW-2 TaxID=2610886 RepID=UPI00123C96FC|nr:HAMP domain-containing sensor histidine kinase [Francisella sp. SYW-2]